MWHQKTLSKHQGDWLTLYSSKTCYMCLRATPQYRLQCRHIICDMCYRKLGKQSDLWKFEIHHCFLCHQATPGNTLEVKPPTATARLLCIDGGGVRGIIPLVVLQALEERVGLPYPVYGNFDFIFGTSAGRSGPTNNFHILTSSRRHYCSRSPQRAASGRLHCTL